MADAQPIVPPLVASQNARAPAPLVQVLHDWIVTVDHKRLGLMYFCYGILFLVIGGVEATIMRAQLAVANNHLVSPEVFNRLFTMHGTTMIFFAAMPIVFGFANYLVPLDDRRARHGVSPPECLGLLDERAGRHHSVFQLYRWFRIVRRRQRA